MAGRANLVDDFFGTTRTRQFLAKTLPLYMRERTLTAAEILALHTTGIEIVPAPEAGLIHIPVKAFCFLDYNSAAYAAIAAGDDLQVRYTNVSGAVGLTVETTGWLDQTADGYRFAETGMGQGIAVVPGAALVWALGGQITTGNSPIYTRLYYHTIPAAFGF